MDDIRGDFLRPPHGKTPAATCLRTLEGVDDGACNETVMSTCNETGANSKTV